MSPAPGTAVRVEMTKWGGTPHWQYDATYLGSDEHGDWVGIPAGTHMSRPGAEYVAPVAQVGLAPTDERRGHRWWLATFHDRGGHYSPGLGTVVEVYVDMTTPPVWQGDVLRAVDLDLDVVRATSGRVWVDDEDEFAERRVSLRYPEDVCARTTDSCEQVRRAVVAREAPYDGSTHLPWLEQVAGRG